MGWKSAGRNVLRWGLWLFLGVVFIRGVVTFLPQAPAPVAEPQAEVKETAEPAGMRAIGEMFARDYLTWTQGAAEERAARMEPYLARGMDRQAGWAPGDNDAGQQVEQTWVYDARPVSPTRWQVTVAARVVSLKDTTVVVKDQDNKETARTVREALPARTVFLAVPVGKTEGGWVVYDYPSLIPAPEPAAFGEPVLAGRETGDQDGRARALLTDFFRAYMSGGELTYYLAPGVQMRPVKAGWSFQQVSELTLLTADDGVWALSEVAVQDPSSGARYTHRYTVKLADRDGRWYVSDMLQKGE